MMSAVWQLITSEAAIGLASMLIGTIYAVVKRKEQQQVVQQDRQNKLSEIALYVVKEIWRNSVKAKKQQHGGTLPDAEAEQAREAGRILIRDIAYTALPELSKPDYVVHLLNDDTLLNGLIDRAVDQSKREGRGYSGSRKQYEQTATGE